MKTDQNVASERYGDTYTQKYNDSSLRRRSATVVWQTRLLMNGRYVMRSANV